jgi:tetratricopeptide (TPR) repeat protein
VVTNGKIEELLRFHVWLPDLARGVEDLAIHAHQPFAQSWTIAGGGTNRIYSIQAASTNEATHAEYVVSWNTSNPKENTKDYHTHQKSSTVVNTGKLVQLSEESSAVHTRNMMYTVAAGAVHKSEIDGDALRATLFLFDSSRGFQAYAPVLGPVDGAPYTQERATANITVLDLVSMVDCVRSWETMHAQGLEDFRAGLWEESLRALRSALHLVEDDPQLLRYKQAVLGEIGHAYRMLGKYELACQTLEDCVRDMPWTKLRIQMVGELGATYNLMARLEDAKKACQEEYDMARELNMDTEMCRAIGNLGMVNFELYQSSKDAGLLDLAMAQLQERVDLAQKLKTSATSDCHDAASRASLMDFANQRKAIALSRLSLCYTEKGLLAQAIEAAHDSLKLTMTQGDPTKTAFSRYFYGRALLLAGKDAQALQQFNPVGTCTPTIALCKEPAKKHRAYIQEMIDAGADMELRDEQGYSALDCAVYNGDVETQKVIENGLRLQYERQLERLKHEALLRKSYREIIQDELRPVLLKSKDRGALAKLRESYSTVLKSDAEKRQLFDGLKYVRLEDFIKAEQIPTSHEGLTQFYVDEAQEGRDGIFVVFMSYRWIAKDPAWIAKRDSPDDIGNTQYKRMINALERLLTQHPEVHRDKVRIWIVRSFLIPAGVISTDCNT